MFDVTVTSNLWVLHPGQNLGLQLVLEGMEGELEFAYSIAYIIDSADRQQSLMGLKEALHF